MSARRTDPRVDLRGRGLYRRAQEQRAGVRMLFERLWRYLRRLIVGDDEGGIFQGGGGEGGDPPPAVPGRPDPNRALGEELQKFFLRLLRGDRLRRYQSGGRVDFVGEYLEARGAELEADHGTLTHDEVQRLADLERLLNSADLREIEAHIGQITGSGRAVIQYVVCPPM